MFGRYQLHRLVRSGATSEVYEASVVGASGLPRPVALKRLRPELAGDLALGRRFEEEARRAGRVHHENLVGVLEVGNFEGLPFQVLEHVDGLDLLRLEAKAKTSRMATPPRLWAAIIAEAARGLEHLHALDPSRGMIHGELDPSLVLVSMQGEVKLADLGRAFAAGEAAPGGDPAYRAPEERHGGGLDARADVFALGCILHRMIAGYGPQDSDELRERASLDGTLTISSALPPELAKLVQLATAPDLTRRLRSAGALAEGCARYLHAQGVSDPRAPIRELMGAVRRAATNDTAVLATPLLASTNVLAESADLPPTRAAPFDEITDGRSLEEKTATLRARESASATQIDVRIAVDELAALSPADHALTQAGGLPPEPAPRPSFSDMTESAGAPPAATAPSAEIVTDGQGRKPEDSGEVITDGGGVLTPPPGYTVLDAIAEGGFAQVYRARHAASEEIVALKILRRDRAESSVAPERFEREAEALAKIDSPYLVKLRESGRLADGRPWLSMDYLKGRTLAHEIVAARGPLPPARVRRIARDLAMGLAALHEAGLVHRDLGARNVMISEVGGSEKAMIIDLGHARWTEPRGELGLTLPGLVLGNARWMAPEQIHAPSSVGPEADLYSLGLLILAMTTGKAPFVGSPSSLLEKQLEETPEIPPGPFAPLIRRLIEKDPKRRLGVASAVAAELNQIAVPMSRDGHASPTAKRGAHRHDDRTLPLAAREAAAPEQQRTHPALIFALFAVLGVSAWLFSRLVR